LVNGSSVRQVETPEVTYWHIELAAHDVILAEKLPVESYLENGNRDDFEGGSVLALHPLFAGGGQAPCAPILRQGPLLDTVMAMLNACDPALSGAGLRRAG